MSSGNWLFDEPQNVMVLTSINVITNNAPILWVSHDEDDGMWQFHDSLKVDIKEAMMVSLAEIVNRDPSVNQIADLPLGWKAWRISKQDSWKKGLV